MKNKKRILHYLNGDGRLDEAIRAVARAARLEGHQYNFSSARHFDAENFKIVDCIVTDNPEIIAAYAEKGIGLWGGLEAKGLKDEGLKDKYPDAKVDIQKEAALQVEEVVEEVKAEAEKPIVPPRKKRGRGRPRKYTDSLDVRAPVKEAVLQPDDSDDSDDSDSDMPEEWPDQPKDIREP